MKWLFLFTLFFYGTLNITARTWGGIKSGDEEMFSYTYKHEGLSHEGIHRIEIRVPQDGEPERHNITWVSIDNRNNYNARLEVKKGGPGKGFVTLFAQYPEGAPANVVFTVRGTYLDNAPCKHY